MRSFFMLCICLLFAVVAVSMTAPTRTAACGDEDFLQVVDKQHPLARDYVPNDLTELSALDAPVFGRAAVQLRYYAALAFAQLAKDAAAQGHHLVGVSGYRSYAQQRYVFSQNVWREMTLAEEAGEPIEEITATLRANGYSARAGYSEHQLGTTLDVSSRAVGGALIPELLLTASGQWLMQHAHTYGFVISYPLGKEHLTGYVAEPWHLRWVGESIAQELYALKYLDTSNRVTLVSYLQQRKPIFCGGALIP